MTKTTAEQAEFAAAHVAVQTIRDAKDDGANDGKSYSEIRSSLATAEAERRGCVVVLPKPNELFVDVDSEEQLESFDKAIGVFQRTRKCRWRKRPSPSGEPGHWHVVVTVVDGVPDARTRILWQAILGSDPVREALSLLRLECGDENPTLFFERAEGGS